MGEQVVYPGMKALKDGHGEQRQRISDELRQLKQMSNRLRTKSLQALMERHAAKREEAKPAVPVKAPALPLPLPETRAA